MRGNVKGQRAHIRGTIKKIKRQLPAYIFNFLVAGGVLALMVVSFVGFVTY